VVVLLHPVSTLKTSLVNVKIVVSVSPRLKNGEWKSESVQDRFEKKLSCWIGKLLSNEDRLVLINAVLTSMSMFMLSFLEISKGVSKRLNFFRSRFFWQSDNHKRKYRLTK
jgi:hypothetical protein